MVFMLLMRCDLRGCGAELMRGGGEDGGMGVGIGGWTAGDGGRRWGVVGGV